MYAQIYEYNPLSLFFVINMYNTMFYNIYNAIFLYPPFSILYLCLMDISHTKKDKVIS